MNPLPLFVEGIKIAWTNCPPFGEGVKISQAKVPPPLIGEGMKYQSKKAPHPFQRGGQNIPGKSTPLFGGGTLYRGGGILYPRQKYPPPLRRVKISRPKVNPPYWRGEKESQAKVLVY